ncbi:MAG: hypothetical protein LBI03_00135 [Clostridiales bacterium]|jgi:hypothetical protein|nr:hypothetical protein [Clostridiales bacterium]
MKENCMKIQFMHPGKQKPFKTGKGRRKKGYQQHDKGIIGEWNNDKSHYRKFLSNSGYYINGLAYGQPKQADLFFWGEWEANTFFESLQDQDLCIMPNGVHRPFHSTEIRGHQNTDPYVYGDCFKYCTCKQTFKRNQIEIPRENIISMCPESVILFGSNLSNKFYIDTVFVVKSFESSSEVIGNDTQNYSQNYRETTLEQLGNYLKPSETKVTNKLFHGQTWWDNKEFFSFVPCKTDKGDKGFERFYLSHKAHPCLSTNPTGVSYLTKCELTHVVEAALNQGFKLAVKLDEPKPYRIYEN